MAFEPDYVRDLRGRPREATSYALVSALTVDQSLTWSALKMTDQLRILARPDPIPITNPVIVRAAAKLGITPDAWFDAAGAPAAVPA